MLSSVQPVPQTLTKVNVSTGVITTQADPTQLLGTTIYNDPNNTGTIGGSVTVTGAHYLVVLDRSVTGTRKLDLMIMDPDGNSTGSSTSSTASTASTTGTGTVSFGDPIVDTLPGESGFGSFGAIDNQYLDWSMNPSQVCNAPTAGQLNFLQGVVLKVKDKYEAPGQLCTHCQVKAVVQVKKTGGGCQASP